MSTIARIAVMLVALLVAPQAQAQTIRVLVTNDDGIGAPTCAAGSVRGVVVVPLAESQDLFGRVVTGYTQTGPNTYTAQFSSTNALTSDCTSTLEKPTTDIEAMNNGFASVTPLNPQVTPDSKVAKFKFLKTIPFN